MSEEGRYSTRMYWRYVWRERIRAKFFSPYRAIPAVLVFAAQFIWKRTAQTRFKEMWIAVAIIIGVYMALFMIESLWKFAVSTSSKIYGEQVELIGELTAKNSFLESDLREPKISRAEERKRNLVAEKINGFSI